MDTLLYLTAILFSLAAIVLNVVSLPGNWFILIAAAALSIYHDGHAPHWAFVLVILVILLAAEAVEFLGGMIGAKTFGASRTASWAAIAGALVGGLIGIPPVTAAMLGADHIVGAIAGAFLAAWVVELLKQKSMQDSLKAALGAALGRGAGLVTKIFGGLAAWLVLVITAQPWFRWPWQP
jgi:uncharacterized protein